MVFYLATTSSVGSFEEKIDGEASDLSLEEIAHAGGSS